MKERLLISKLGLYKKIRNNLNEEIKTLEIKPINFNLKLNDR